MRAPPVDVLLVGDHSLTSYGLRVAIDQFPTTRLTAEVTTLSEAVRRCARGRVDVVVVNAAASGVGAVALVRAVRRLADPPPVLCLLPPSGAELARQLAAAGASGLLYLTVSPRELEAAVLVLRAGCSISLCAPAHRPRYRWDAEIAATADPRGLSGRELDVLRMITEGRTNAEIAIRMAIGESTVKTHVRRVLRKLGRRSRAELAALAYERYMIARP
ncbi:response regulator transcription factor [Streptoalloteichus hindustanus]|uniref:DNA-binding response regulator, NarL/FixJ family, contains REC and HTH domains n=1 Tax=Streptoalloteichus hindustanus TaxID=2017 RepID=A0A1M5F9R7_STRHI|nr:response regulator transcription factor [Streptoalloteichus hindustanus]SHF88275.1 DNA-binding response regulator, NarL/FixJ family, contains REC and HTH domains [Streptoalloteichus hindustanus]